MFPVLLIFKIIFEHNTAQFAFHLSVKMAREMIGLKNAGEGLGFVEHFIDYIRHTCLFERNEAKLTILALHQDWKETASLVLSKSHKICQQTPLIGLRDLFTKKTGSCQDPDYQQSYIWW